VLTANVGAAGTETATSVNRLANLGAGDRPSTIRRRLLALRDCRRNANIDPTARTHHRLTSLQRRACAARSSTTATRSGWCDGRSRRWGGQVRRPERLHPSNDGVCGPQPSRTQGRRRSRTAPTSPSSPGAARAHTCGPTTGSVLGRPERARQPGRVARQEQSVLTFAERRGLPTVRARPARRSAEQRPRRHSPRLEPARAESALTW